MENIFEKLKKIKAILLDVDGVLTDGSVLLIEGGAQIRKMNTRDGYAIQLAVKKGLKICVITGGKSEDVKKRMNGLGVSDVYLGCSDKLEVFENYLIETDLLASQCLYMGDDIPDFQVMQKVGIASCPKDASEEIKEISHYISPFNGGLGCVRDIIEKTLRVQEKWFSTAHEGALGDFKW